MISIRNLTKYFGRHCILDNISVALPRTGIIGITGPSGCGKSTFLKVLAGLITFDGHIRYLDHELEKLTDVARLRLRQEDIGLIYQSYRLFEEETVFWNVAIPLFIKGIHDNTIIRAQVIDLLIKVKMHERLNEKVKNLSGGEKQRVALARALIKQPRLIVADEPTAALDTDNATVIMQLLQALSHHRLIIIVSHQHELIANYCDVIYHMKDGAFISAKPHQHSNQHRLNLMRFSIVNGHHRLPWGFCFRHAIMDMKEHKWRLGISQLMLSIALLATGIGVQVTTSIKNKMTDTLTSLVGKSGLQIKGTKSIVPGLTGVYSLEEDAVKAIQQRYQKQCPRIGVAYHNEINNFFPDRNEFFISIEGPITALPSFTAQHFADALIFEELGLPSISLANDEIALALPPTDIQILARKLYCEATAPAINNVINSKTVFIGAGFANYNWQYEDEQLWQLRHIIASDDARIIHQNPRFNEYVFETSMRFPTQFEHDRISPLPWTLTKSFYLVTKDANKLIQELDQDLSLQNYRFDHIGYQQLPSVCPRLGRCHINRIIVYLDSHITLPLAHLHYLHQAEAYLTDVLIGTSGGYLLYPESLISGFIHETFITTTEQAMDQIVDGLSVTSDHDSIINLPIGSARGHYRDQNKTSIRLKSLAPGKFIGRRPQNLDEIAMSSGLVRQLFQDVNPLGLSVQLGTRFITSSSEGYFHSEFLITTATITAISDDETYAISGMPFWSVTYYRDYLGINGDQLRINVAYFEGDETIITEVGRRIEATFDTISVTFPQKELHQSITTITNKITIGVLILAIFTMINAVMLASFVVSLSYVDMEQDRRLLVELGAEPRHIYQLIIARLMVIVASATLFAIVEFIVVSIIIERLLSEYFVITDSYTLPIFPLTIMVTIAIFVFGVLAFVYLKTIRLEIGENI